MHGPPQVPLRTNFRAHWPISVMVLAYPLAALTHSTLGRTCVWPMLVYHDNMAVASAVEPLVLLYIDRMSQWQTGCTVQTAHDEATGTMRRLAETAAALEISTHSRLE